MRRQAHLYGPFRKRLDAFARELSPLEDGGIEALHRVRVASRRLRELLPLLDLDPDRTRKLTRSLRKVTNQLGSVRELDVLTLLIEELAEDARYCPAALKRLGATVSDARGAARERLSAKLPAAKLRRLALKLEGVSTSLESDNAASGRPGAKGAGRAWLGELDARLARRAARVREAVNAAGVVYAPVRLHGVRIALKKLRYAAELAAEVRGSRRTTADIVALKAAQSLLGRLHDLEMLLVRGREAQVALSPPDFTVWRELGSLVHAVEDDCRQRHAGYVRSRERLMAIAERMGAGKGDAQLAGRRAAS